MRHTKALPYSCPAPARRLTPITVVALLVSTAQLHAQTSLHQIGTSNAEIASTPRRDLAGLNDAPNGLSTTDWSSIHAAYESNRHAAFPVDGGYRARNPGQQWLTHFDGRGFITQPDVGDWSWGLQLERYGFAGREREISDSAQVVAQGERVAYDWDATLQEWYVNDGRGLEHGYTVHARPPGGEGPLSFVLSVRGDLAPQVQDDGRTIRFANADGATVLTYGGLAVFDANGCELAAGLQYTVEGLQIAVDDHGATYPLTIDPVAQQAYLKPFNTNASDNFGRSVSVSGNTVVVGAPNEDSNATGVNGNAADNSSADSGAAYVFVRSASTWSQQAYLKASNTRPNDAFGWVVSISGDTVVIGAPGENSSATDIDGDQYAGSTFNTGSAYVFVRNGTTWSQQAYLKASNTGEADNFGWALCVSGDTAVIGAVVEDSNATGVNGNQSDNGATDAGAAYVFVRNGTAWSQQAYLKASNTEANDNFGYSVSVSGDTTVVGASQESSNAFGVDGNQSDNSALNAGAAYVFVRNGTTWSQQAYLKASNTETGDRFGISTSVSGGSLVVGANGEDGNDTGVNGDQSDNSAANSGAAYVFVRGATSWSQQAYLKAFNTEVNDNFGWSVSLSGDLLVAGAYFEDSNAIGIDGSQSNNAVLDSGAAYVFARTSATWGQLAYLKSSNSEAGDSFGWSVSISDDTVVAGAYLEDSNAVGVNGDQSNNSEPSAGAVYVFIVPAPAVATKFCFGDGSSVNCPCSNNSVPGQSAGCLNSNGIGATLALLGSAYADPILVVCDGMPPNTLCALMRTTQVATISFASGDGLRCLGMSPFVFTTQPQLAVAGSHTFAFGALPSGQTRYFQVVYRDANLSFCTPSTLNYSNVMAPAW